MRTPPFLLNRKDAHESEIFLSLGEVVPFVAGFVLSHLLFL